MNSRTTRTTQYTGANSSRVTEVRTTTGPDGRQRTEKRYGQSGPPQQNYQNSPNVQGVGNNFEQMNMENGRGQQYISMQKAEPLEAGRYAKGWGHKSDKRKASDGPAQKLEGKTYAEIKAECLREGKLFEDPDFPAVDQSIFYSRAPPRPFVWKRPHELVSNPQLFVGGASRFDVQQGELGDCWLLAAVASLCGYKDLLYRVVPPEQSFEEGYAGIFHFQFWQYGKWTDIIVDDRLPTYYDRLVFMHSAENNEFWTPLLEKAYAKIMGSYESLKGGATSEAMEDFTGGVTEVFDFRQGVPPNLFPIMQKAYDRKSLMGCSIEAVPGKTESELPNGLICGHAYSLTSVKLMDIETPKTKGKIPMVRIRNPWGNEAEWKGAWSDSSPEWKFISEASRKDMGLTFDDDGEFWMSFSDFTKNFQKLEVCNLGPDAAGGDGRVSFQTNMVEGSWMKKVTAGGCRNFPETFWTNPQYRVQVIDADDDDEDDEGTLIIGLMQKNRRAMRKEGADLLTMGYAIYRASDSLKDGSGGPLDMKYFKYNASVAKSPSFINMREITGRHKLPPGNYCVLPSTFEPNQEGEFLLRIFSEKKGSAEEIDEETGMSDVQPAPQLSEEDVQQDQDMRGAFKKISGDDMEIDAYELQDILNAAFMKEFKFDGFSSETCRSMVAMMDIDRSGKLGYDEFKVLWNDLRLWKSVFKQFDADRSGTFNSYELRQAFHACGFKLSNSTFNALVQRYSHRDGKIYFDDFIHCTARLKTMFDCFREMDEKKSGKAIFELDEFIQTTMYS
jgi:calpain